jgi:hypothetical protein
MSNVSGAAATSDPYATGVDATADTSSTDTSTYLSPEALLLYCQSRLQSIDSQIDTGLASQEKNNSELEQIGEVLADMKAFGSGTTDPAVILKAENGLHDYIMDLKTNDPNNPNLSKLIDTYNQMVWSGSGGTANGFNGGDPDFIDLQQHPPNESTTQGDNDYSADEAQGYIATVQSIHDNMNTDSELTMINIQSLMSQRQTAVQLTTNLMQSLDDQAKQIAQNIGH